MHCCFLSFSGRLSDPQNAFLYYWSYAPKGPNGQYPKLAHHACEQPFVFHVLNETKAELAEDGGVYVNRFRLMHYQMIFFLHYFEIVTLTLFLFVHNVYIMPMSLHYGSYHIDCTEVEFSKTIVDLWTSFAASGK